MGRRPLRALAAPTPFGAPIESVHGKSVQGPPRPVRRPKGGESGEWVTQLESSPAPDDRTRPVWRSRLRAAPVLARGDPRGGAAAYRDVVDPLARPGHRTRVLAPAAMEEPSARVAVAVVGEAHRRVHHMAEGAAHPRDLRVAERAGPASRIEPRLVQDLIGDPVPHSCREAL